MSPFNHLQIAVIISLTCWVIIIWAIKKLWFSE